MRAAVTVLVATFLAACGEESGERVREPLPCPSPRVPAAARFDARTLEGLLIADAEARARRFDCTVRRVEPLGKDEGLLMDLRANRINVAIENRRIREVKSIE